MGKQRKRPDRTQPMIEELERRLLFSADVPLLVDPSLGDPDAIDSPAVHMDLLESQSAITASVSERREIVFVDAGVDDGDALLEDLRASGRWVDVVLLDSERDGIEQITAALHGQAELDAIHIVSHGSEGAVQLGSTWLDGSNLAAQYKPQPRDSCQSPEDAPLAPVPHGASRDPKARRDNARRALSHTSEAHPPTLTDLTHRGKTPKRRKTIQFRHVRRR